MLGKRDHSAADKATALLATCFVVIGGAVACSFIVVMVSDSPGRHLAMVGASFAGVALLLWLLRDKPPRDPAEAAWGWLARRRRPKTAYRLKPRSKPQPAPTPIAPPTAESVRDLSGGLHTWVPTHGKRPPRNQRNSPAPE